MVEGYAIKNACVADLALNPQPSTLNPQPKWFASQSLGKPYEIGQRKFMGSTSTASSMSFGKTIRPTTPFQRLNNASRFAQLSCRW